MDTCITFQLPPELLVQLLQTMGDILPLKAIFSARRVNTMFADELTKRILQNNRLEKEGLELSEDEIGSINVRTWPRCPKSLKLAYLRFKFDQHDSNPSGFSSAIMELCQYGETHGGRSTVLMLRKRTGLVSKLLEGVSGVYGLKCHLFTRAPEAVPANSDSRDLKVSYEALLAVSAVERGDSVEFDKLINSGVEIEKRCNLFAFSPIHSVARKGTMKMASACRSYIDAKAAASSSGGHAVNYYRLVDESSVSRNKAALEVWIPELRKDPVEYDITIMQIQLVRCARIGDADMLEFFLNRSTKDELPARYWALGEAIKGVFTNVVELLVTFPRFDPALAEEICNEHPLRLASKCEDQEKRSVIINILLTAGLKFPSDKQGRHPECVVS